MAVDECYRSFTHLLKCLSTRKAATVGAIEDRNLARATVEAWFRTYRPQTVDLCGESDLVREIDLNAQEILRLSLRVGKRSSYKSCIKRIKKIFSDELLVEAKIAEWRSHTRAGAEPTGLGSVDVVSQLRKLEPALEASYRQVLIDLTNEDRVSFKGAANELREVLREVLKKLAPDSEVKKTKWFKDARSHLQNNVEKQKAPTQAERVRFIMQKRVRDSTEIKTVQESVNFIHERLGRVVRALYGRASSASHVQKSRQEIISILRYIDAVLSEMLPQL